MLRNILFLILLLSNLMFGYSQDKHEMDNDHHHNYEIGFGAGIGYIPDHKEFAPGFHMHLSKSFGKSQQFSLGPGIELLLDEHKHTGISLSFGYRIIHPLYVAFSPGIEIPLNSEEDKELSYCSHFEIIYAFEAEHFHLGPALEYAIGKHDSHLMLALHVGIHL